MYNVMIIEDDFKIRTMIHDYLKKWGFEPVAVEQFDNIIEQFLGCNPHLVLLDINLPSYDGFYWCNKIRQIADVPIIFISSRTDNMDIIMAMNMGGDDFIQKPFSLEVLVAKMNAVLRRSQRADEPEKDLISAGGLVLNIQNSTAYYQNEAVSLTKNEFHILYILMKKTGQIVARDDLMKALWEDEQFIDDNTLTVNINRLRKKLEAIGLADAIVTKKRQGYLLP
ncbi:response regulator transcription factor [Bacillus sp. T33-2]|uniref:response regulator transcription factor n=1 Tax=Bacillus sp. T33-2 TaxID=2054168 RepID=UPI000C762D29|nr:response regulator transcription factor [Bacillus sp. T33-2]PLR96762.1 DNA-binding response regulator [Bacillus sp. T33-2]